MSYTSLLKNFKNSTNQNFRYITKRLSRDLDLDLEHSSFVPLFFACTGGAAPGSTKTVQKLAEKLSEKRNESYSGTINYKNKNKFCTSEECNPLP